MAQAQHSDGGAAGLTLEFVAKATLIVILLLALAHGLWLARDVLFITFFALLVASFLSIFVDPLHRRGIRRSIAAPAVLAVMLVLFTMAVLLGWPTLRDQFTLVQQQLPSAIDNAQAWIERQLAAFSGSFGQAGDDVQERLHDRVTDELSGMIGGSLPLLNTAVGALAGLVLVMAAGLFIAISPRTYMRGLIVLIPRSHRQRAGEVLPLAGEAMVQWMKGTAIGMLIIGVLSAAALWLLGIPAALALGVIAGLLEFIPYIGPTLSFLPAIAVALAISPEKTLWVIGAYAVIQIVETNVVVPLLMKKMVRLPPALTLLFQALMATLFGFLGLLLAVPILASARVLIQQFYIEGVADEH